MVRFSVVLSIVVLAASRPAHATTPMQIATEAPPAVPVRYLEPPQMPTDVMLGRLMFEPYIVFDADGRHPGGRFGGDMMAAIGEQSTRFVGGLRFLIGVDGSARDLAEFQLMFGVAQTIQDRAVVALVAPLGFSVGSDVALHGYAGIEAVAAIGRFSRDQGPAVNGIELAGGVSNRGARARFGFNRPGRDTGVGFGIDWQRDSETDLVGIYFAATPGR